MILALLLIIISGLLTGYLMSGSKDISEQIPGYILAALFLICGSVVLFN